VGLSKVCREAFFTRLSRSSWERFGGPEGQRVTQSAVRKVRENKLDFSRLGHATMDQLFQLPQLACP